MTPTSRPPVDADLPHLLAQVQAHLSAGDDLAAQQVLAAIGPARLVGPTTLVGALCRGGVALAAALVAAARPELDADAAKGLVLDAFFGLIDPPPGAGPAHERELAAWLIDSFELQAKPESLLDIVRAAFLIDEAPLAELPEAVLGALRHEQWALALRGLQRLHDGLGDQTPRNAYGLAAMCLHQLGRFDEAEAWTARGLGEQAALLALPPVFTQAQLLQRWGRFDRPVVSIICPTYNHERYIDSAIRGFLAQDCPYPFEILVHDDASTDRTAEVVRRWQAQYPALIKPVLQTENQFSKGVRPFELMLARAQGDFVATCEGDDYWTHPGKLRKQVGYLMAHPEFSCSAHNYVHFFESTLTAKPWSNVGRDFVLNERQLMRVQLLLWLPTLVFRKTFTTLPPERDLAGIGDQFLTSFLGTQGRCVYFETMLAAVRRENEFSIWSPLPQAEKERRRIRTWAALAHLHQRLGFADAAQDLRDKITASRLDASAKRAIVSTVEQALAPHHDRVAA